MSDNTMTVETIRADVRKVATAFKRAEGTLQSRVHDAAETTFRAYGAGMIGKPEDGAEWTGKEYAAKFGKSPAWNTLMRRLGKCASLGFSPSETPEEWTLLSSKAKANAKDVAAAIEADDATPESIREALTEHVAAAKDKAKKGPAKKDTDGTEESSEPRRVTVGNVGEVFEQAVATVAALLPTTSPDNLQRIEDACKALLEAVEVEQSKDAKTRAKAIEAA